jgi:ferric-dicitrate binding protein FerR (iron transport regulator)
MEELVIRLLQGAASAEETGRVEEWRAESEEHEVYYQYLEALWRARQAVPSAMTPAGAAPRPSSFEIIRRVRERRNPSGGVDAAARNWRRVAASAAAIVLLAVGIDFFMLQSPPELFGGVVSTSATEIATLTLGDGTVVRIGPKSSLRFPEESERREVWLDGEAFFSVAKVEGKPFVVHTRTGRATALSTRFRVITTEKAMKVGVLQGRVAVEAGETERELVSGEVGQVTSGKLTVERAASLRELEPNLGSFLAFRTTPLWMVAEEVEDFYGVQVELESGEVGGRTVTASFQDASFQELMSVVCRITATRCTMTDSIAVVGVGRSR